MNREREPLPARSKPPCPWIDAVGNLLELHLPTLSYQRYFVNHYWYARVSHDPNRSGI
jgi:hypothetical protein